MKKKQFNKNYIFFAVVAILVVVVLYKNMAIEKNPQIKIETSKGDIILELDQENAPVSVENFLSYVDSGFYDGTVFHRVIDGFMIQGGGFTPDGNQKKTNDPIILESDNGLKNDKGTIAMARTNNPNSATSQFFINSVDNDFLNKNAFNDGYAVFGHVIEGIDVVESIEKVSTTTKNRMQDWPVEDVMIISVSRI